MSLVLEIVMLVMVIFGSAFVAIASIGLIRMPDLYSRLHVASKAPSLGLACLALALVLHFGAPGIWFRAAALGLLLFVTAPISAHLIARAGFSRGADRAQDEWVVDESGDMSEPGAPHERS